MLQWGVTTDQLWTVRAAQDRRLMEESDDEDVRYLWTTLENAPCLGTYKLQIQESKHRQKRIAKMDVKATKVVIRLYDPLTKTTKSARLNAVLARELGTTPSDEEPIEWLLLTNAPVESFKNSMRVINNYALRWRIEPFHKTWKDTCGVEKAQLRDISQLLIWATILGVVAMRIQRLTHLAREKPNEPATVELTQTEIDAIIVLRQPDGYTRGDVPTIGEAVFWLGDLGGRRSRSSKQIPGPKIIARGLADISVASSVLNNMKGRGT